MEKLYQDNLSTLLNYLNIYTGEFFIEGVNVRSEKYYKSNDVIVCVFVKTAKEDPVQFNILSRFAEKSMENDFKVAVNKLGFLSNKDTIHSKLIFLNSDRDINNIVEEVVYIFEDVCSIKPESEYNFDDKIDMPQNIKYVKQDDEHIESHSDDDNKFHTLCAHCNVYLHIPEKFSNDSIIKCPNCGKNVKNPLFYKRIEQEKAKRAGSIICSNCGNTFFVPPNKLSKRLVECPTCDKYVNNTRRFIITGSDNSGTSNSRTSNSTVIILILIGIFIFVIMKYSDNGISDRTSPSSSVTSSVSYEISYDTYGVKTLNDFRLLDRYLNHNDDNALIQLNRGGKTTILLKGLDLEVIERSSSYARVRIYSGFWSGEEYYVDRNSIKRSR